VLDSEVL
jgi:hypothetical protein